MTNQVEQFLRDGGEVELINATAEAVIWFRGHSSGFGVILSKAPTPDRDSERLIKQYQTFNEAFEAGSKYVNGNE
jgi:hypothetical protein